MKCAWKLGVVAAFCALPVATSLSLAPGAQPAEASATLSLPLDPTTLEFFEVSLSNVVNRALADEEANDGQGGWTDQGPGCDMRGFGAGQKNYGGVPFRILEPLSCVVLNSRQRPQSKLPQRVTIPVNRRADVLYVLHTGALLISGRTNWTYVIHYTNGRQSAIPVVPGVNVRNWEASNNPEFDNPPGMRTVPAPERVGNALAPVCGAYIMEWLNPRRDTPIRAIEMISSGDGIPILLAITGGVRQ